MFGLSIAERKTVTGDGPNPAKLERHEFPAGFSWKSVLANLQNLGPLQNNLDTCLGWMGSPVNFLPSFMDTLTVMMNLLQTAMPQNSSAGKAP